MCTLRHYRQIRFLLLLCISFLLIASQVLAQQAGSLDGRALYDSLKKFELQGKASVSQLKLKKDRGEMTFTGDFYFMAPVNGRVTGAVFIGQGTFLAAAPAAQFEKDNLKRFLNADQVSSDFRQAVLRFNDSTYDDIANTKGVTVDKSAAPSADAQKLANEMEPRLLKETGTNISSRIMLAMLNKESSGVFLAQFEKGQLDRFTFIIDPQTRIPSFVFGLDAGEKVMIFRYAPDTYENDIWIATFSEDDFKRGKASLSSSYDLISPDHYKMDIDLREPRRAVIAKVRIDFESSQPNLRAFPMIMNEAISANDNDRLKYSMKLKSAKFEGKDMAFVQEEWEIGLTLILPKPLNPPSVNVKEEDEEKEEELPAVELQIEGNFIDHSRQVENLYYPQAESSWYPRYGYLKRSTYDLTFRTKKGDKVSSVGRIAKDTEWPDNKGEHLTEYVIATPITFASFTMGLIERHQDVAKLSMLKADGTKKPYEVALDFYSVSFSLGNVNEGFVLAELKNALQYFNDIFGPYIYTNFRATFHPSAGAAAGTNTTGTLPAGSKSSFATMVRLPPMVEANRDTYKIIGRQTASQWWGNVVSWRSYRDQWLGDGFAEYSGILYTKFHGNLTSMRDQLKADRFTLPFAPTTSTGKGTGKIAEAGSILLGKRLTTRTTRNAPEMIINKGALVLRMLHFLYTDPSNPLADDKMFTDMLKKFEQTWATKETGTEEFKAIAEAYYKDSPIAKIVEPYILPKPKTPNLDWFFEQWVNQAKLPSYRLEYEIVPGEGNKVILKGDIYQENAGENWIMPIPVIVKFSGKRETRIIICARGPKAAIADVPLPEKPNSVELDPDMWILSEKTTTKSK
jgi:hypothetical protein